MSEEEMIEARDAFYARIDNGEPYHWRDVGPNDIWEEAWRASWNLRQQVPDGWIAVGDRPPSCSKDKDALGVPVLIWPPNPSGEENRGIDGHAYYGRRATGGRATFYKYGAEIHGVTHWRPMPEAPKPEDVK